MGNSPLHCFQVQLALEQCADPPCTGKAFQFLGGPPHIRGSSSGDLTNFGWYNTVLFTTGKKSLYKWTLEFQTPVVQGATLIETVR